jgi:hypothetical protein
MKRQSKIILGVLLIGVAGYLLLDKYRDFNGGMFERTKF